VLDVWNALLSQFVDVNSKPRPVDAKGEDVEVRNLGVNSVGEIWFNVPLDTF